MEDGADEALESTQDLTGWKSGGSFGWRTLTGMADAHRGGGAHDLCRNVAIYRGVSMSVWPQGLGAR